MAILKKYWILICIGLILRLVLAGTSFHSDVRTAGLSSAVLFQRGSLNFYEESKNLSPQEVLDDLPLSYLILLPIHGLARPLVDRHTETLFLISTQSLLGSPGLIVYLLWVKLPMILFDLGLGLLLILSVAASFQKKLLIVWMFNPFTLWATSMIGQMDIFPAFFISLAWYLISQKKLGRAALALGAGGAIKSSPFLLVPLLLGLGVGVKEKIKLALLAILPYLMTVTPYFQNQEFRQNAFLAPQLTKSFFAKIPLSGGEAVFIVPATLGVLYLIYFSKKREINDFLNFSIIVFLLTLSFTHFHIQWFLWVMPFLLLWLIANWTQVIKLVTAGLFFSLILMMFLFDASLQIKLFAPLIPSLDHAKGLAEVLSNQQVMLLRSLSATIFASCSIFISWKILRRD